MNGCDSRRLIESFEIVEEGQLVFDYRAAEREPGLQAAEEGVGGVGYTFENRIGPHIVVAKVTESAAVIFVAPGARDDVHRAHRGHPGLQIEVEAGNLEFLNRINGIILSCAPGHRVDDVSA